MQDLGLTRGQHLEVNHETAFPLARSEKNTNPTESFTAPLRGYRGSIMMNHNPWGYPPPPYYYPPIPPPMNPMSCTPKEFKQWLKIVEEWQKSSEEKTKKKSSDTAKARTFTVIEVFLVLMAMSPFIALLYKSVIIPALLR